MARSIPALINSHMLVWAREEAGYNTLEQAAEKAHFPVEKLRSWETNETLPTLRQAEKLARLYNRPFSVFCLATPPKTTPLAAEYRRLPGVRSGEESPELRLALRQMIYRRKVALELLWELGDQPEPFSYTIKSGESPEQIAVSLRNTLGISIGEQQGWPNEYRAWHEWRAAVENIGALVFQFSKVKVEEIRGLSLLEFPLPVIGINSKEIPASKPFSLLHELVHVMLACANEEKPALMENRTAQAWTELEKFTEAVAGAVLMPAKALLNEWEVSSRSTASDWDIMEIRKLARRYKVTPKAMITRLLLLHRCTPAAYRRWTDAWEANLKEHPPKPGGGIATPAEKALNRNGRSFSRLVLEALTHERITAVEAARYLELNYPHIETLRRNLAMARQFEAVTAGTD